MKKINVNVEDRELTLSNLDKVFWPDEGFTKGDLINYYRQVARYLKPHLLNRPVTMKRYPDGIYGKSFYQKDCPDHAPAWITTVPVTSEEKDINYIIVDSTSCLLWLANMACIEMHPWLSSYFQPLYPDVMIFDLDPNEGAGFAEVLTVAPVLNEALLTFGLIGYPKTSGSSGLHIYVPVEPRYTYAEIQQASLFLASAVTRILPDISTIQRMVAKRGPRVYIDCLQNARGKTVASVYSIRPRPGAPVSFPVSWDRIKRGQVHPLDYNLKNVPALVEQQGDKFSEVLTNKQSIDTLLKAARGEIQP